MMLKRKFSCILTLLLILPLLVKAKETSLTNPFLFTQKVALADQLQELQVTSDFKLQCNRLGQKLELKQDYSSLYLFNALAGMMFCQDKDFAEGYNYLYKATQWEDKASAPKELVAQVNYFRGIVESKIGEQEQSLIYLTEAQKFFQNQKDKSYLFEVMAAKGIVCEYFKDYSNAIYEYRLMYKMAWDLKDSLSMAQAKILTAQTYTQKGDYDFALSELLEAKEIFDKNKAGKGNCRSLILLGEIFYRLGDYEQALSAISKGIERCSKSGDNDLLAQAYFWSGEVYLQLNDAEMAREEINKFSDVVLGQSDTLQIISAKTSLGKYYTLIKDYSKALISFHQAAAMLDMKQDVSKGGVLYLAMAELYLQTKEYSQSKSYAQKALVISTTLDEKEIKARCYQIFADIYEKMNDYQSSLYYRKKADEVEYMILNKNIINAIRRLSGTVEDDSSKKVIKELERENISLNYHWLREKNKGYILWGVTSLFFVFTVVLLLLFRANKRTGKALKLKNAELESLNATKDKFFSIIAHDLKSPFNSLMGFSEMLSLHAESKSHDDIMEYSKVIHNSTRKLYSLVDTLLQWSRTQLGTTEYKPERMDVAITTSNIVSILRINAEEKDIVISVDVPTGLISWADKDLYSAVLRNLVSNAIKFSRVGSVITVSAAVKKQNIEISVSDSGVGITKENLDKIFKVDSNISTQGTFNEKGTGLGLVLCKEFVEINRGAIWAESKLEKGSTFTFTIPLAKEY